MAPDYPNVHHIEFRRAELDDAHEAVSEDDAQTRELYAKAVNPNFVGDLVDISAHRDSAHGTFQAHGRHAETGENITRIALPVPLWRQLTRLAVTHKRERYYIMDIEL